ncbi:MAG: CDP-alcohol phosphatidyltransferase family protein [Clostridia bacterium]|nr:CDP-alcohol phosphatidyltransferase family protein [Clostridia bacterium]MBR3956042.1 CDP-alcohol phosphatidyltransferase family protein [Clostridia bacterium]
MENTNPQKHKKTGDLFDNVWTIPNLLSALRIVMVPIIAVLFLKGEAVWAVVVLALSGLSDFFDGKIARRFNQISALGKILDPIADKLTQITLAVVLFYVFWKAENESIHAFAWVFLLFVAKELIMLIGGAVMLAFEIRPGAAEMPGKVATMVFYVVMVVIVAFGPEVGAFRDLFTLPDLVMKVLVVISVILTFVAFAFYLPETFRQFKERFSKKK